MRLSAADDAVRPLTQTAIEKMPFGYRPHHGHSGRVWRIFARACVYRTPEQRVGIRWKMLCLA